MQQLTQQLKSGKMEILEVPFPALGKGQVLVRNHFSVISAGTEGKTVTDARKGYIAKTRSRHKEVKQVLDMIRTQGLVSTYNLVMNKLEAPSPLGYSCAGEVMAVGEGITNLQVGDHVACGGQGAFHADVVAVNRNLCVKVPNEVDLRHAAFTTISCIALQGIRLADVQVGGNCVVIGLGLIGQLTMQLLDAGGIRAIGIDIDPAQVEAVNSWQQATGSGQSNVMYHSSHVTAFFRNQSGLEQIILDNTGEHGADAVIITAATSSTDPVDLAGILCRKKGKVVIVGAVPTGFSRENYYKKELDLRMSSSYGPGRYDPDYEEKGHDYPASYVRWTENRNMQAFVDLLSSGRLNIESLITHTFPINEAPDAYDLILGKKERFAGILIRYSAEAPADLSAGQRVNLSPVTLHPSPVTAGLVGAGNFAQNMLLPRLKGLCDFVGVASAQGNESVYVAKKYGFAYATGSADKIIGNPNINTVFITTRHNLHAEFVIKALLARKNVFVEKPLAINLEELKQIRDIYLADRAPRLMVGFNRRFSPHVRKLKLLFPDSQPKAISIRINAGAIQKSHWTQDSEIGGGRIIGEVCHFIDLAMFLAGSTFQNLYAKDLSEAQNLRDTLNISLSFKNGSIASISYFSNGNKNLPKEVIEVFSSGISIVIEDFRKMTVFGDKTSTARLREQDKGHREELVRFTECIRKGLPSPIPFEELYMSTFATLMVHESLNTGRVIEF